MSNTADFDNLCRLTGKLYFQLVFQVENTEKKQLEMIQDFQVKYKALQDENKKLKEEIDRRS
jgi:hypothetical protein